MRRKVVPYCIQGRGWKPGEVKEKLSELIAKYKDCPKQPAYTYEGPPYGQALSVGSPTLP